MFWFIFQFKGKTWIKELRNISAPGLTDGSVRMKMMWMKCLGLYSHLISAQVNSCISSGCPVLYNDNRAEPRTYLSFTLWLHWHLEAIVQTACCPCTSTTCQHVRLSLLFHQCSSGVTEEATGTITKEIKAHYEHEEQLQQANPVSVFICAPAHDTRLKWYCLPSHSAWEIYILM